MVLYKYRGFSNLQFVLDIFINKRLYASDFQDLNDPMEGAFIYSKGIFSEDEVNTIIGEKAEYKILSLSETSNNMLMWSYYAEAHQGFVVGVELSDNIDLRPVEYVESVPFISTVDNIAKSILTKKLKLWTHEQEHRAFKQYDKFVNVERPQHKSLLSEFFDKIRNAKFIYDTNRTFYLSVYIRSPDIT